MRVGILTHICWPETADFKNMTLARELVRQGHRVTIITGFPNYPLGRIYDGYRMRWRQWEEVDGVRILRVPLYPDHSASGLKRMVNYGTFSLAAATIGVALSGPIDALFVYSPPMTLGLPARLFKSIRGARVLLDVVDLWPDAVAGSGMTSSNFVAAGTSWFARQAYRTADLITVLTEGYAGRIRTAMGNGVTEVVVRPPWSEEPGQPDVDEDFYEEFDLQGKFRLVHTGNIGPFQDIDTVLDAASILRTRTDIRIVLVGGGRDLERIRSRIVVEGLGNVVVTGSLPPARIPGILAGADCCLVSLRSDAYLDINLPSKVPGYLASGRPLVVNASGEIADLVSRERVGVVAEPGNAESLADQVAALADMPPAERAAVGPRARDLHKRRFDSRAGVLQYVDLLERLARDEGAIRQETTISEADRITSIYEARGYDSDPEYADTNPVYLQRIQKVEQLTLRALRRTGHANRINELEVLDFGCGNARWLGRWLAWGADPERLHGVDVRDAAVVRGEASFPHLDLRTYGGERLPFPDNSFDVVYQNLVFSSILDLPLRAAAARELARVLRPSGVILWYDLKLDNPRNRHVRGLRESEVRRLFPAFPRLHVSSVTLAPPVARRLVVRSGTAADLLERFLPPLRSHLFIALSDR